MGANSGSAAGDALTPGPSPKSWERGDLLAQLCAKCTRSLPQAPLSQPLGEGPGVRASPATLPLLAPRGAGVRAGP
jgi:hypothetical protein